MSENELDAKLSESTDAEAAAEAGALPYCESAGAPDDENNGLPIETVSPLKVVEEGINGLNERVAALEKLFQAKILHAEHEEIIVDQMHKELQQYKEDMYAKLVRPILLDVITMRDSILNVVAAYREKTEGDRSVPLATVEISADEAQVILEKNGVDVYRCEEGSDFIPVRQKAIKKIITNDQNLHGKVARSLSDGYSYNDRTISPGKVAVYYYERTSAQPESNEEETHNG